MGPPAAAGVVKFALVSQVARRHGGSVTVGTSPLGGTEFTVTLGGNR